MRNLASSFLAATMIVAPIAIAYAQAQETIAGTVEGVDEAAGTITLKHGPIKSLGMDMGMTMQFGVQDASMLKGLKVGDSVTFQPAVIGGKFVVTRIEKAN
jgi:Cu/Ag efflux protein CusF